MLSPEDQTFRPPRVSASHAATHPADTDVSQAEGEVPSIRNPVPTTRDARRIQWEQTGEVPSAAGGAETAQSNTGDGRREAKHPHSILDPEQFVPFLRTEFTFPAIDTYVEARFARLGLVPILEEAGVLPRVEDPNPYDLAEETAAYEQYWAEHPDEHDAFFARIEERRQMLRYLHIGAILGHVAGRDLYPGRSFPR